MSVRGRWELGVAVGLIAAALVAVGRATLPQHSEGFEARGPRVFHEDPLVVPTGQDAAALLQYFNDALQAVTAQRLTGVGLQLSVLGLVSVFPAARPLVDQVGQEIRGLSSDTKEVDAAIAQAQALLRARRPAEARRVLVQARQLLRRNGGLVQQNRRSLRELAGRLGVPALPVGSPARQRFERIQGALTAIDARDHRIAGLLTGIEKGERLSLGPLSASVQWAAPAQAYPARPFVVAGVVTTAGQTDVPRELVFDLDGRVLGRLPAAGRFQAVLTPPADFPSGEHTLTLFVEASGEYTETTATHPLRLVRYPLAVTLNPISTVVVPGTVTISGRVRSPSGPVTQTRIEARFGGAVAVTGVTPGGRFTATVAAPPTDGLVGGERVSVSVFPAVPWEAPAEAETRAMVVNLWGLGLACALISLAAVYVGTRRRRTRGEQAAPPHRVVGHADEVIDAAAAAGRDVERTSLPSYEEDASAAARVMRIYATAVSEIEEKKGIYLRPHMTLREFERAAAPHLQGHAFAQMTALAEFALYSSGPVAEERVMSMLRLGQELDRGLAGDRG